MPYGGLKGGSVGGIYLQRKRACALQFGDKADQNACLVNIGKPRIYIKYLCSAFELADAFCQQKIEILLAERGGNALLAGGVEALADNCGLIVIIYELSCRADQSVGGQRIGRSKVLFGIIAPEMRTSEGSSGELVREGIRESLARRCGHAADNLAYEVGIGTAAAADQLDLIDAFVPAAVKYRAEIARVLGRRKVVYAFAVNGLGKARIGLDDDGNLGIPADLGHHIGKVRGAQRTVHSDSIDAESAECGRGRCGMCAEEGSAVLLIGESGDNGKVRILLDCQHCGLHFEKVRHGLYYEQVGAGFIARDDLLFVQLISCVEFKLAEGLQHLSGGADILSDKARARLPRDLYACADQRSRTVAEFGGIGAEGIGSDNVGACLNIGAVDIQDLIRLAQVPLLGKCAGLQTRSLKHGAHAAVKE